MIDEHGDPTDRQFEIWEWMVAYQRDHAMPPTVRAIGSAFGIKSPNGVICNLAALVKKGWCRHVPNVSRAYVAIVDDESVELRERLTNLTAAIRAVLRHHAGAMPAAAADALVEALADDRAATSPTSSPPGVRPPGSINRAGNGRTRETAS